jgi:nucleoside-triphosphatase THEP1
VEVRKAGVGKKVREGKSKLGYSITKFNEEGRLALAGAARDKAGSTLYEKSEAQRCEEGE